MLEGRGGGRGGRVVSSDATRNREAMHDAANIDIIDFSGVRVELVCVCVCVCVCMRARARR